ncbi:glycosyltransferase family 4 protein [Lachnoclostridium pacaense]|uniref:glycosyltransferase family 4 protein n=1 Tax=Enterocloster hominis (ex Hitch et al. 2024) TaxID=1917870 RepID=UPI001D1125DF|nr:glycosyltransferase family 4 protein [Lachnoclostridium pacaense]MCC2816875.1 glycosyltransferase family 4 protein [Lachnoclostridium pacaense]MCC2878088.1 glycosyltransferase family 4 protein [Lachnoclostridium pacaense]
MKKILHLCLSCFYIDGYSYQENLLPKYHKKLGYDVEIIASLMTFDSCGKRSYLHNASRYMNEFDIPVQRLAYKIPTKLGKVFRVYEGTFSSIEKARPDIIFMHGIQFADINSVIRYVEKYPNTMIYADNHSDFSNSATNWISKNIQHKIIWKYFAKKLVPYVKKFYGVLPARVNFMVDLYGLPKEKVELLVMGADDELVNQAVNTDIPKRIRVAHGIDEKDFLIISGGKIDQWKQQTLLLMDAVNKIERNDVKLIIFGSVTDELKDAVEGRCSTRVQYIGWVKSEESYGYFAAADLVVFPGRHSVFWEQVAGQGIPMIVKYWEGTTHIDFNGNVEFLYNNQVEEIADSITKLLDNDTYTKMKQAAQDAKGNFLYSDIAKRSIS